MRLAADAPAKINRELRVGRLRSDGYHEIWSRMVSIDLADRLSVEPAERLEFSCEGAELPVEEGNLVVRAAERLAARAGIAPRARLRLEKRIPVGGGLGGGSADAAITLRLLARLWELPDAEAWMPELAAELGSDVSFFLVGGEAEATGRGEIVTPVEDSRRADLLLLVPPFPIATASVYRTYAGAGALPPRLEVASPRRETFLGPNDLASAVLQMEPRMGTYLESAARATADYTISGSGATIALSGVDAAGERELSARHPEARLHRCQTLLREEYRRRTDPRGV